MVARARAATTQQAQPPCPPRQEKLRMLPRTWKKLGEKRLFKKVVKRLDFKIFLSPRGKGENKPTKPNRREETSDKISLEKVQQVEDVAGSPVEAGDSGERSPGEGPGPCTTGGAEHRPAHRPLHQAGEKSLCGPEGGTAPVAHSAVPGRRVPVKWGQIKQKQDPRTPERSQGSS